MSQDQTVIEETEHHLALRNLRLDDYNDIKALMDTVYANVGGAWPYTNYKAQVTTFPEGQICIEDKGKVVAFAISVIVDYDQFGDKHSYDEITGDAYLTTHDPNGDVLYGVEVIVCPEYRGLRLGRTMTSTP